MLSISKKNLLLVSSVLVLASLGCDKKSESQKNQTPNPEAVTEDRTGTPDNAAPVLVNATNSQTIKVSESKYSVLPSSQVINTISLANDPIKKTCKEISKLSHEHNKIEADKAKLEAQKAQIVALVAEDNTYEGTVDELQTSIDLLQVSLDEKSAEISSVKNETLKVKVVYSKSNFLKNIDTLKKANSGIVFEIKAPSKTILSVKSASGKAVVEQTLATSLTEGAFDESESAIKMNIEVNYNLLCTLKSLNSAALTSGSKSKLEMSFAE